MSIAAQLRLSRKLHRSRLANWLLGVGLLASLALLADAAWHAPAGWFPLL